MNRRLVVVAALAALALVACSRHEPPPEPVRPAQLVQVEDGAGTTSAVFAGEVKPRVESDLGFRIGGKIVQRYVDVGARVKRGQPLARLDPADVALQAQAQQSAVTAAEAEYAYASAEHERYRSLYAQKFVSASALDQKRNAMNTASARLEQARAQLAVTHNQSAYATLAADADGVITAVNAETGQVVSAGQSVMKLAREEEHEVAISVPESRIGEVQGAKVLVVVLTSRPDRRYAGRVREITPAVDPATRTFGVRVTILDPDPGVRWGMTANVGVQSPATGSTVRVPLTSIYHQPDGGPAVWIYDPSTGTVDLRGIEIRAYREDGVVVGNGLRGGDWIVAAGVHKLQPGQRVRPYEAPGEAVPPGPAADATTRR